MQRAYSQQTVRSLPKSGFLGRTPKRTRNDPPALPLVSLTRRLKETAKRALARRGYELYRRPWLPKGIDPYESLRSIWPDWQPRLIFDVGANVGQTAQALHTRYPSAQIHSFEPVPATFAQLRQNLATQSNTHVHCLALSDRDGQLRMAPQTDSTLNSLNFIAAPQDERAIPVRLQTAAQFCHERNLASIDLFKIDVEGAELSVLRGATPLLASGGVGFILAEAGFAPGPSRFTPLSQLIETLQPHGYWLVGVYEQLGWHHLHAADFCNALFAPASRR